MQGNQSESLFQRLTRAIVERVTGSITSRLDRLRHKPDQGPIQPSDTPRGLIGQIASRWHSIRAGSGARPGIIRQFAARAVESIRGYTDPAVSAATQTLPTAVQDQFKKAFSGLSSTLTGAMSKLANAIPKAKSLRDRAESVVEMLTIKAPARAARSFSDFWSGRGYSPMQSTPQSTPGARRLRTKRIRALMWGRSKQAWNQIKATWAARRSIAAQQKAGTLPYDRKQLETVSLRSIVSGSNRDVRRSLFGAKLSASMVRIGKRTGLDWFANRRSQFRAAKLVKRATIRLNSVKRRIHRSGLNPALKTARDAATQRLTQAQGLLTKSTLASTASLGRLAATGVGATAAVAGLITTAPFLIKSAGDQSVARMREYTPFSAKASQAMADYDVQSVRLSVTKGVQTAETSKDLIKSQMELREAMIKLEVPLTNLANRAMSAVIGHAAKGATLVDELMKGGEELGAWMWGGNKGLDQLQQKRLDAQAREEKRVAVDAVNGQLVHQQMMKNVKDVDRSIKPIGKLKL